MRARLPYGYTGTPHNRALMIQQQQADIGWRGTGKGGQGRANNGVIFQDDHRRLRHPAPDCDM